MDSNHDIDIPFSDFLEHYGVKGMKWGVRKDRTVGTDGGIAVTKRDVKWKQQYGSAAKAYVAVNNNMAGKMNRDLPGFNKKYEKQDLGYDEASGTFKSAAGKRYVKEYEALASKNAALAANEVFGVSPSGNWKATANFSLDRGLQLEIVPNEAAHGNIKTVGDGFVIEIPVEVDSSGFFMPIQMETVEHAEQDGVFLEHYGVKGMKWGVRRRQKSSDYQQYRALRKKKVSELSNAEMRVLIERMNLQQQHRRLNPSTVKKGLLATAAIVAATKTLSEAMTITEKPAYRKLANFLGRAASKATSIDMRGFGGTN